MQSYGQQMRTNYAKSGNVILHTPFLQKETRLMKIGRVFCFWVCRFFDMLEFGAVVQWLEYLPVTQGVVGSSPIRTANGLLWKCTTIRDIK